MADERLRKTTGEARESRAMNDRPVTEDRQMTDQERLDMFRQSFFQSALPNLPKIPGYHVCWLTTTDPRDAVPMRLRYGYELITTDMVPGWESTSIKSGEYAGYIGVNEMLAARIPTRLYEMYMAENHHAQPNKEQSKLADVADRIKAQAQKKGADLEVESGFLGLRETSRAPVFSED
jgi:hypothetical protein